MLKWEAKEIEFHFNFSEPGWVSLGQIADKVYVKVKDISMFVSNDNGISLDESYSMYEHVIILPKQLQNGVDEEVVETAAKNAKEIIFGVLVLQVIF